jgi:uncharacterized repeat protein (TIGR01451 family)
VLTISKRSTAFVRPGSVLVYEITYGNAGGSPATGVVITETVPVSTAFSAAGGTPGWSCADGSPAGTECTLPVPDLPPSTIRTVRFAVVVDAHPTTRTIENTVLIGDAEGGGSDGEDSTIIGEPAPMPALTSWAFAAAVVALLLISRRRL